MTAASKRATFVAALELEDEFGVGLFVAACREDDDVALLSR